MYLAGKRSPANFIPFPSIKLNASLNNVAIKNQHIRYQKKDQRDKVNRKNTERQLDIQIN